MTKLTVVLTLFSQITDNMGVNYWRFVLQKKKLLDVVRDKIRFKYYSISTERTYIKLS
jgi:hypothetical protein